MTVRLSDIAREAGVSVMTVSNVMNGKSARVSPATSERVKAIADRLGYVPNLPARSLAASKSHIIAALVPVGEDSSLFMSPHTVSVIGSLEQHLRHQGYHVLLRGIERESDIAGAIRGWNLDGAVLMEFKDTEVDRVRVDSVPLIAVDSYSANPRIISVRTDDRRGGWLAGSHLTQAGHQHLLFAGPPADESGVIGQRWEGFRSACVAAGIAADNLQKVEALTTFEDGKALGLRLHADYPSVTAVFATADSLAIGIMTGIAESGSRVPEDISIIGFDDIDISPFVTPSLTTIAQDVPGKGAQAARLILGQVSDEEASLPHTTLAVELVERESVTAPRS